MTKFSQQIKEAGKQVSLHAGERAHMRATLIAHIESAHPANAPVPSPWPYTFFMHGATHRTLAVLLIVGLVFGTGAATTYASQDALPGETLYSLKTVSEELRAVLARTPVAKAIVATERAHRRLAEAAILAGRGTLNDAVDERLTQAFDDQAREAEGHIAEVETTDTQEAESLRFELVAGMEAQEHALVAATPVVLSAVTRVAPEVVDVAHTAEAVPEVAAMKVMAVSAPEPDMVSDNTVTIPMKRILRKLKEKRAELRADILEDHEERPEHEEEKSEEQKELGTLRVERAIEREEHKLEQVIEQVPEAIRVRIEERKDEWRDSVRALREERAERREEVREEIGDTTSIDILDGVPVTPMLPVNGIHLEIEHSEDEVKDTQSRSDQRKEKRQARKESRRGNDRRDSSNLVAF
ncbi:MAG: DUF5667 domain-containing protein [Patescibacteria group bacterium]